MDLLGDYRSLHHQRYLERERLREEEEKVRLAAEQAEKQRIQEYVADLHVFCNVLESACCIAEAKQVLENIKDKLDVNIKHEDLLGIGGKILEVLHSNPNVKINLLEPSDIQASQDIKELSKLILTTLGLDASDIDLEFEMDCSKDEEIARALAESWGSPLPALPIINPPVIPRRRGRPRKNRDTNATS